MKFRELTETFKRLGENKWILDDFEIDEIRLSRTNDTEEHIVIITKEIDGYGHIMDIPILTVHCRKENHASRQ